LSVLMSAPMTSIMLVQAALYRNKARNSAPPSSDSTG
jgi:hypothetical protein